MKHAAKVLTGVLLMGAAVTATAQETAMRSLYTPGPYPNLRIERITGNFELGLSSKNDGVLESTLSHIVWLRLVRPDINLDRLQGKIAQVVTDGRTPSIRYRAALAEMVLDSPASFACVTNASYSSANELFAKVSDTAKQTLIGFNR